MDAADFGIDERINLSVPSGVCTNGYANSTIGSTNLDSGMKAIYTTSSNQESIFVFFKRNHLWCFGLSIVKY